MEIKLQRFYEKFDLPISNFKKEKESQEYDACRFEINDLKIISRSAKITPKKIGQFVTFWKRNINGIIEPLNEKDAFDFYSINVYSGNKIGLFIFPKSILIKKRIISTLNKEGKRGFRVYPIWDNPTSKQAIKTQEWQSNHFFELVSELDKKKIKSLFISN